MTIEIRDNAHYVGIWFLTDKKTHDWLGVLSKPADGSYRIDYRFRYYVDNKAHDSDDRRNYYVVNGLPDEKAGRAVIDRMTTALIEEGFAPVEGLEYIEVDGDGDRFMAKLCEAPFAHVRTMPVPN